MEAVVVSDVHGAMYAVNKFIKKIGECKLLIISGDLTHFGTMGEAINILEALSNVAEKTIFIPGNCDPTELLGRESIGDKIINIHGRIFEYRGYVFYGIGGSNITPFNTWIEFSEDKLRDLINVVSSVESSKLIIVTHVPPYKTLDKTFAGVHVGSRALREFLDTKNPRLWISGHIHESRGVMNIDGTLIVNPGPLRKGFYAVIESFDEPKVRLCRLK